MTTLCQAQQLYSVIISELDNSYKRNITHLHTAGILWHLFNRIIIYTRVRTLDDFQNALPIEI